MSIGNALYGEITIKEGPIELSNLPIMSSRASTSIRKTYVNQDQAVATAGAAVFAN